MFDETTYCLPPENSRNPPMRANSAALTPESDPGGKIDVAEAKRRLATLKQGSDIVINYFDKCLKLIEIVKEGRVEKNDLFLFTTFMNGLNERARKIIQYSNVSDALVARKIAIQEEMFATASSLQPGVEEDRMHKIEILSHCQWEKLRYMEGKFTHVQHEVHQVKKDVGFLKESFTEIQNTLNSILILSQKNEADKEAAKQAAIVPEEIPEEKEEDNILNRVVAAQESLVAKLDSLEKIDKIQKINALNYEWIRQVYIDVKRMSQTKEAPATPAVSAASPNPQATIAPPVVTSKRSPSSLEEHPPQPPPKRKRTNEQAALELLYKNISDQEFKKMVDGDVMVHIVDLMKSYSVRADNIRGWMKQIRKPISRPCLFCGAPDHHSYECATVTDIDERKRILRAMNHCMECSKHHQTKCKLTLECRICINAKRDNCMVMGGVTHCRMFCPLQEEYYVAARTARLLSEAHCRLMQ